MAGNYGVYDESTGRYYVIDARGQRPATQAEASAIHAYGGSYTFPENYVSPDTMGYGVYDESKKKYVVYDLGGRWRDATPEEAATIQAAGGSYTAPKDPTKTTLAPPPGSNAAPAPAAPPAPTPEQPAPAPAPQPAWQTQQSWWGTLFPKDTLQRTAYDLDPSFAWATATNQLGGNTWAPRYDWMARQQGRYHTVYGDENTRAQGTPQGNMTFADWIEQHAGQFGHDFDMMPASQKGYNNMFQPAGRQTF